MFIQKVLLIFFYRLFTGLISQPHSSLLYSSFISIHSFIYQKPANQKYKVLNSWTFNGFIFHSPRFFEKNLTTVNTMTEGYFPSSTTSPPSNNYFLISLGITEHLFGVQSTTHVLSIKPCPMVATTCFPIFNSQQTRFYLDISWLLFPFFNSQQIIFSLGQYLHSSFLSISLAFSWPSRFSFSIAAAPLFFKYKKIIIPIFIILILLNSRYFKEDIWFPNLHDSDRFTESEIIRQRVALGSKIIGPNIHSSFPTGLLRILLFCPARVISMPTTKLPIKLSAQLLSILTQLLSVCRLFIFPNLA